MQERDRQKNEAEADAKRRTSEAKVKAQQIIVAAQADKNEKILLATASRDAFLARQRARTQLSMEEESKLLSEALGEMKGQSSTTVNQNYERRRKERISQMEALNDFRLFWDALGNALKSRDTVIIDADKVPGRRHLFLFDLNELRVPAPLMLSPNRTSTPNAGAEGEIP
jgi:hypothetical protein